MCRDCEFLLARIQDAMKDTRCHADVYAYATALVDHAKGEELYH